MALYLKTLSDVSLLFIIITIFSCSLVDFFFGYDRQGDMDGAISKHLESVFREAISIGSIFSFYSAGSNFTRKGVKITATAKKAAARHSTSSLKQIQILRSTPGRP